MTTVDLSPFVGVITVEGSNLRVGNQLDGSDAVLIAGLLIDTNKVGQYLFADGEVWIDGRYCRCFGARAVAQSEP